MYDLICSFDNNGSSVTPVKEENKYYIILNNLIFCDENQWSFDRTSL